MIRLHHLAHDIQPMRMRRVLTLTSAAILVACTKPDRRGTELVAPSNPPVSTSTASAPITNAPAGEWKTTATGLKYQVLKTGTGTVSPKPSDTVKVHYTGRLTNGTLFDSSQGGDPITFPLNGVIPGWTEGLQLMKVGDLFKFEIPPNLAYGANSPSPSIPPNSTLVFEVELLGIQ